MNTKEFTDLLRIEGVNAKGFGTIPKMVMQDMRLTIEAKSIYSYFCSYAGAGTQAFPSVSLILQHLGISETRYYKHFKLLKQYGYIRTKQLKISGKYSKTLYTLCTNPTPTISFEGTAKSPSISFECTENESTQNEGSKKNSILKLSVSEKNQSINQADGLTDSSLNYSEVIAENIEYEALKQSNPHDENIDDLYNIIVDTVTSEADSIKIGKDKKPIETVKSIFLKLNQGHIEYVVQQLRNYDKAIKNPRAFAMTCLYNSYFSAGIGTKA